MATSFPTGTITFLFTDIEASTQLAQRLGKSYRDVLGAHFDILRRATADGGGREVKTIGDGYFAVFPSPSGAVETATTMQLGLADYDWPEEGTVRVRIGIHTGEASYEGNDYVGLEVHRTARLSSAANGGQVVVSAATHALTVGRFDYVSLGSHQLAGLEGTDQIYQLVVPGGVVEFPPLRTATSHTNNLPGRTTSLLGRETESDTLVGLVDENRLVTLLGPGGVGKTSLAVSVAARLLPRFPDGVTLVDISSVSDPDLVMPTIAAEVGSQNGSVSAVAEKLRTSERLLLLDNFEQVLNAAEGIDELVSSTEKMRVLVTSQAPLNLVGEQRFALSPLDFGNPDSPAVRMFIERATAVDPQFSADIADVVQLVGQLDGLPLAIEIAAARANILTVGEMMRRLENDGSALLTAQRGPERHRSLEAALQWSYDLLSADDRAAFRRLSIFAGGATFEAAETIVEGEPVSDALVSMAELVNRSLVLRQTDESSRFRMLDGVRRFANSRLGESADMETTVQRYLQHFSELAADASTGLQSDRGEWWNARLDSEQDNIRDVLKRLHESNNAEDGLSLLGGIWRFYQSQGQLLELELWLDRFFALADPSVPSIGLTRGLMARGALRYWQRDLGLAGNDYRLAVETARQFDDELLLAEALYGLSSSVVVSGDDQEAKPLMEEARAIYERRGDKGGVADIIAGEAFATLAVGGLIGLGPALTEARDLYAAAGRSINSVQTRYAIAGVAIAEGRIGDARNSAREGVEAATSLNDPFLTVWGLEYLALIDIETGARDRGAKIVGACQTARVSIGGGWGPGILGLKDGKETLEDMIGVDQAEAMISPGRTLSIFDAVRLALGTDPSEP